MVSTIRLFTDNVSEGDKEHGSVNMIMIMIFPFGVPKVVLSNLIYYYFSSLLSLSRSTTHRKTEQLTDNKAKESPEFNLTIHPSRRTRTLILFCFWSWPFSHTQHY